MSAACCWVDFLRHIRERGTGAGIGPSHAAVADSRKKHSHHGDEDGGDHMAVTAIAECPEGGHWRHRLNHDDAVQYQVPERQRPPQAWRGTRCGFVAQAFLLFRGNHGSNPASL